MILETVINQTNETPKRKEISKMERAKLMEMAKKFNEATYEDKESGEQQPFLTTKIRTVAVKDAVLKASFIAACETLVDTDVEELVPEDIVAAYDELIKEKDESSEEGKAHATETKESSKAPAEKKAGGNLPVREKDTYGSVKGTMSSAINEMLAKGSTMEAMCKMLVKDFGKEEGSAEAKIRGHIKFMQKERGLKVNEKDGVFTIAK